MDITGKHVAEKGKEIYGLVVICIQTYNVRIYGIQNRKVESISLALEVLVQEFGLTCDREGAFQQLAKELKPKEVGALEATHQIQFRFSVANGHFSTGLVERRMRSVHDYIVKLKMQGAGMSITNMSLMFQYMAFQLNTIPYGIRNINSFSETKMQELRQAPELLSFIRPADWLLFTAPKGVDFRSIQNNLESPVKTAMDKLNALQNIRNNELLDVINEQYCNVNLETSNKLKVNSVVLLKNIANEPKCEPLKLARVNEIKKSRDGSQRVIGVTYHNVSINKKGE